MKASQTKEGKMFIEQEKFFQRKFQLAECAINNKLWSKMTAELFMDSCQSENELVEFENTICYMTKKLHEARN